MNIVLTNDDGINSLGLKELEKVLKNYGNVYVVAPSYQQSAKGCATTAFLGLKVHKIDDNHYAVDGTPVDCVEVACAILNTKIDLVVSGCNEGYNLGVDIMYSGTCGACFQASIASLPAIAFSCKNASFFYQIEKMAPKVLDYIFAKNILSNKYYLNVNLPENDSNPLIKLTRLTPYNHEYYFPVNFTSFDNTIIIDRKRISKFNDENYDENAIKKGFISITPLSQNLFKDKFFNYIKKRI